MSRRTQRLILATLTSLLLALGLQALPAQAADTIPTTAQVTASGADQAPGIVYLTAYVFASGEKPTGSVVFTGVGDGTPVPLNQFGSATIQTVLTSNEPFPVSITFTGTNGFADATASTVVRPLQKGYLYPEATVLNLVTGTPRLTMTMTAYVRNALGGPLAGRKVTFTLFDPIAPFLERNRSVVVCNAVSDANGRATCGAVGLVGSIVSLLGGGAYASFTLVAPVPVVSVKLPVVLR